MGSISWPGLAIFRGLLCGTPFSEPRFLVPSRCLAAPSTKAQRAEQLVQANHAKLGGLHRGHTLRDRREALKARLARLLCELRRIVDNTFIDS